MTSLDIHSEECDKEKVFEPVLRNKLHDKKGRPEPEGSLKEGVGNRFSAIFEYVQKYGALYMQLFCCMTTNTSSNARNKVQRCIYV